MKANLNLKDIQNIIVVITRVKEVVMGTVQDQLAVFKKFEFERPPVGVRFTPTRPKGLERPGEVLDFCEMLAEAQQGRAFYVTREDFTCIGPLLLGMDEDPIFETGRVGPRLGAYKDERANRRIYQYLPRFPKKSIGYVAFAPLDKLDFEPDLLIIMASVSQAEIFIRAKGYDTGEMWTARGTPVAGCAWLYVHPYLTGEMNFTVTGLGFGMKARRLFPEGRILLTVPWDRLPGLVRNLEEMEWVPEAFTLGREGHKQNVRRIAAQLQQES
jgi:uncharacterized protein (DUF169 family)